jgi:hypothetical protein
MSAPTGAPLVPFGDTLAIGGGTGALAMWVAGRRPDGWVQTVPPAAQARITVHPALALERRLAMHRSLLAFAVIGIAGGAAFVTFALVW